MSPIWTATSSPAGLGVTRPISHHHHHHHHHEKRTLTSLPDELLFHTTKMLDSKSLWAIRGTGMSLGRFARLETIFKAEDEEKEGSFQDELAKKAGTPLHKAMMGIRHDLERELMILWRLEWLLLIGDKVPPPALVLALADTGRGLTLITYMKARLFPELKPVVAIGPVAHVVELEEEEDEEGGQVEMGGSQGGVQLSSEEEPMGAEDEVDVMDGTVENVFKSGKFLERLQMRR